MELTPRDLKFLTILNETRLADGKLFGEYSEEVSKQFSFSNAELEAAVKKFVKFGLLSVIDAGGNELVYFHTGKVNEDKLDKHLKAIRH